MRQIFLDTETTGLNPRVDRIVEIGCVEMIDRRLTGETRHFYLDPGRPVGDSARVHGLTDEFLAGQARFGDVIEQLMFWLQDAEVLAHNGPFDLGFLNEECVRLGYDGSGLQVTDTLALAREQYAGRANSLDALCRRLDVNADHRILHGALIDANLLAQVYIRLTRKQHELQLDADGVLKLGAFDFGEFRLAVLEATEEELAAHTAYLKDLRG
jgi:DNA polymerase III subunit epsilon